MILALDFETGGVESSRHAPVSLGISVMDGENVAAQKEWIFRRMDNTEPKFKRRAYEVGALEISGVTWNAIKDGTPERAVLSAFRDAIDKAGAGEITVVSHNACFDQAFYADWLFRCGDFDRNANAYVVPRSPIGGPWACTMRMAQRRLSLPDYKLDTIAAHFGLARGGDTHGALEDCILAGRVYHRLTSMEKTT